MEIGYYISSKQCTLLLILIDDCSIIEQLLELSKKNVFESKTLLEVLVNFVPKYTSLVRAFP